MAVRTCGECSMCCKLLNIDSVDFKKPADKWCPNCTIGQGCNVYSTRPGVCQEYECFWLQNDWVAEELRPDKSHVILTMLPDDIHLQAVVDPLRPEAYKQGEMALLLTAISGKMDVFVLIKDKRKLLTSKSEAEAVQLVKTIMEAAKKE